MNCSHCGLEVPKGLIEHQAEHQFCCAGCRIAFELIHEHGLDSYYGLRSRLDADTQPITSGDRAYAEYDDATFEDLYVRKEFAGLRAVELYLEGVHCAACVWLVEKLPSVLDGVAEVRLDLGRAVVRIVWSPETVHLSRIARFLHSIGYPSHPFRGAVTQDLARREDRSMLIRIGVAGLIAGNTMLLAFALYGGDFHGIAPEFQSLFHWLSFGLSLPAVGWCARPFFRGALGALRTRTLHMDLPIVIGILAAWVQSSFTTLTGKGEIYFETLTALIFFLLVGRYLQRRQQRSAASATELLYSVTPSVARRVDDDLVTDVPIEALESGNLVAVRSGETIPADGIVVEGESAIDRSLLTGESEPVPVKPNDQVNAGTISMTGSLTIRVEAAGETSRIGRLMHLLEEEARRRAPVVLLADRVSGWFVGAVLVLATLTLLIWLQIDPDRAVSHAVALLIVSCPCALGLATPLAVSSAIAQAARVGILIKGGAALELLSKPGRMLLDKTGTLTKGKLSLVRWHGPNEIKPLVAALEAHSSHPIARALVNAIGVSKSTPVGQPKETPGGGISAMVDGRRLLISSPALAVERYGPLQTELTSVVSECTAAELTPIVVVCDGQAVAVAGLGDPIRLEAYESLKAITEYGWQLEILSGDHHEVVSVVARRLDIQQARGEVSPEDKVAAVRSAREYGTAVMVGDGVNDAAALAAATVGIAIEGGAEAAATAAQVSLKNSGLKPVADLISGATRARKVIRRNFMLSIGYNIVAVSLAMSGHMQPLLAAVLMPISSLTVVLSSYRTRMFRA